MSTATMQETLGREIAPPVVLMAVTILTETCFLILFLLFLPAGPLKGAMVTLGMVALAAPLCEEYFRYCAAKYGDATTAWRYTWVLITWELAVCIVVFPYGVVWAIVARVPATVMHMICCAAVCQAPDKSVAFCCGILHAVVNLSVIAALAYFLV